MANSNLSILFSPNSSFNAKAYVLSKAAEEGAEGTTEIAQRASVIACESAEVLEQVAKTKQSAEILREEIGKFHVNND